MTKQRKTYHHGDLKSALIQAGLDILEEHGLEALTMRAIASRVGVSHTAPKNHFNGFNGLLSAIAAEGFKRHKQEMEKDIEVAASERDRLHAAALGYVRFARKHPALFRLMFSPHLNKEAEAALKTAGEESYGVLEGISKGLDWNKPKPDRSPELEELRTQLMLWAFVHGYASLINEGRLPRMADGEPVFGILDVMPNFEYTNQNNSTNGAIVRKGSAAPKNKTTFG